MFWKNEIPAYFLIVNGDLLWLFYMIISKINIIWF